MNVLLIGSGGREHALAWKLAQSPRLTRLYAAPGNPGIGEVAEIAALDPADHGAVVAFCRSAAVDLVVVGPEAPLVAGLVDVLSDAGIKAFGPNQRGRAAGRLEGLHQGDLRRSEYPDGGLAALQRCRRRGGLRHRRGRPDRGQGGRARRRQGGDGGGHDRGGARRGCRLLRRTRRGCRDRGVPDWRGSELFRPFRRHDCPSFRHRAGPQARRRRRHRPQYRRNGGLFTGSGNGSGDGRAGHGRDRPSDARCHGQARHALSRRALRRPDADR